MMIGNYYSDLPEYAFIISLRRRVIKYLLNTLFIKLSCFSSTYR